MIYPICSNSGSKAFGKHFVPKFGHQTCNWIAEILKKKVHRTLDVTALWLSPPCETKPESQ